ncbi:MAG: peptidoglycan DD-metalloendopeptidase family protein [Oscillochloridaceae bacterium]|nr:peptidoglycan DD-metalloendopeptidase family protein [Chloroflexaceae bacterium]MDW8391712.1 peptidoglycan DD-metalloendopeptidase family protein [Oscillochloridaceae bacterium]
MSASDDQDRPVDRQRRKLRLALESKDVVPRKLPPQPLSDWFAEDEAAFPTFAETRLERPDRRVSDPDLKGERSVGPPRDGRYTSARVPRRADSEDSPAPDGRPRAEYRRPAPPPEARPAPPFEPIETSPAGRSDAANRARPFDDERRVVVRAESARTRTDVRHLPSEDARPARKPAGAAHLARAREMPGAGHAPDPVEWIGAWLGPLVPSGTSGAGHWGRVALVAVASLAVILALRGGPGDTPLGRWVQAQLNGYDGSGAITGAVARPIGDYTVEGPPSLTPQQIDAILRSYGSPATGTGKDWYNLGLKYGIDPAFAVAFFIHESGAGTNPNWAGLKPGGGTTHNIGNIICAGYPTCYGRFRDYGSWAEGIEDWYRLISVEYIQGRGVRTVAEIIPIYAPAFENDVQGYINVVQRLVDEWRTQFNASAYSLRGRGLPDEARPQGNPLRAPNTVVTQGYGVGTHAPAEVWGAIDLALDGDGDGRADPEGTWERPVYATHSGVVTVTANSHPGGNHVWVTNAAYRTGYAHLASFAVSDGQEVRRGDLIGYIGSTGMSSGPHLDYQVWVRQDARWVNVNPLEYGALEPLP